MIAARSGAVSCRRISALPLGRIWQTHRCDFTVGDSGSARIVRSMCAAMAKRAVHASRWRGREVESRPPLVRARLLARSMCLNNLSSTVEEIFFSELHHSLVVGREVESRPPLIRARLLARSMCLNNLSSTVEEIFFSELHHGLVVGRGVER